MAMVVPAQLTGEAMNKLREGIELLLNRWSALQMAIQNEWGGRDTRLKAQQLALDIYHWLIRPSEALYVDDLENLLDDFMLSLNTVIEDNSIEEIAEDLMIMHEECLESNFASIERLRQSASQAPNHRMQVVNGDDDDSGSGDESMDMEDGVDQPSNMADLTVGGEPGREPAPMVDADGWTMVSSRRNRGGTH